MRLLFKSLTYRIHKAATKPMKWRLQKREKQQLQLHLHLLAWMELLLPLPLQAWKVLYTLFFYVICYYVVNISHQHPPPPRETRDTQHKRWRVSNGTSSAHVTFKTLSGSRSSTTNTMPSSPTPRLKTSLLLLLLKRRLKVQSMSFSYFFFVISLSYFQILEPRRMCQFLTPEEHRMLAFCSPSSSVPTMSLRRQSWPWTSLSWILRLWTNWSNTSPLPMKYAYYSNFKSWNLINYQY